jgi:Glycine-zipper domain
MSRITGPVLCIGVLALGACAVPPPAGPSVMALPGQGKSFAAFQEDDFVCRQYAAQQTGGVSPGVAATNSAVGSAAVGTALGAAAGAAIGAAGGAAGPGAAIGAGAGLLTGSLVGANNAAAAYGGTQQYYDVSYTQCMTAHGDTVQNPPAAYASYGYPAYPYPAYPYPYPLYPYGYYGGFLGPSVAIGFGGGGWGGWGWRGGGWRGGGWGWHGGGWHGGGWRGGGWRH